jgi:hypothetical protein
MASASVDVLPVTTHRDQREDSRQFVPPRSARTRSRLREVAGEGDVMRRLFALVLSLALLAALSVPAFANTMERYPLLAGQDMDVGDVEVSSTELGNILVEIVLRDGWCMTEAHVHQAASPDGFPTNKKGNPKVGQFHYNIDYHPACVDGDKFWFQVVDGNLFAVHAVVARCGTFESAWGGGIDFPGNSWAVYIVYDGS